MPLGHLVSVMSTPLRHVHLHGFTLALVSLIYCGSRCIISLSNMCWLSANYTIQLICPASPLQNLSREYSQILWSLLVNTVCKPTGIGYDVDSLKGVFTEALEMPLPLRCAGGSHPQFSWISFNSDEGLDHSPPVRIARVFGPSMCLLLQKPSPKSTQS
jgi:hypothetical protein